MSDRIWVDSSRTVLVTFWQDGQTVTVATRETAGAVWGPPTYLLEEITSASRTPPPGNQPDTLLRSPGAKEEGT